MPKAGVDADPAGAKTGGVGTEPGTKTVDGGIAAADVGTDVGADALAPTAVDGAFWTGFEQPIATTRLAESIIPAKSMKPVWLRRATEKRAAVGCRKPTGERW